MAAWRAGFVLSGAGGQNLAHDNLRDVGRVDPGAIQGLGNGDHAQVVGGHRTQSAAKRADGRTRGSGDDNF